MLRSRRGGAAAWLPWWSADASPVEKVSRGMGDGARARVFPEREWCHRKRKWDVRVCLFFEGKWEWISGVEKK